jgi:hypothetical protein
MSKLILMSTILGMIAIPVLAAREKDARKGLRKVIVRMIAFQIMYLLALRFLWGRV